MNQRSDLPSFHRDKYEIMKKYILDFQITSKICKHDEILFLAFLNEYIFLNDLNCIGHCTGTFFFLSDLSSIFTFSTPRGRAVHKLFTIIVYILTRGGGRHIYVEMLIFL